MATHKPKGRHTKLTSELQQKLVELIAAGNYVVTACRYVGISDDTYARWRERGRTEATGIYAEFAAAITRAEAQAEARAVALVAKAIPDDWRAGAHFLERRYADRWGRQDRMKAEVTATVTWSDLARTARQAPGADEPD